MIWGGQKMAKKERGSDELLAQLFGEQVSEQQLREAVVDAREAGLKIVRWWWFGQPAIDQIIATFQVDRASLGSTVEQMASMQSNETQVNLEVFPYGIPAPDTFHVEVAVKRNLQKFPG
jgi:hypothetical protein